MVEAFVDGKPVSRLAVSDLVIRIGLARLRTGGVGGVWTDKAWRGRGLASRCMDEAVRRMQACGFHLSMLFGIRDFYHRWGYASVMAEPRAVIRTEFARQARGDPRLRMIPFDRTRHARAAIALEERSHGMRPGTLDHRRGARWRLFRVGSDWGIRTHARLACDRRGRPAGYVVFDRVEDRVAVIEAGFHDRRVIPTLVAAAARQAMAREVDEITFFLPPDHAVVEYLRRWNVAMTIDSYAGAHGMGRIINLAPVLRACETELARRWRSSGMAGRRRPELSRLVSRWPPGLLLQLLLGYRGVEDAVTLPGVRIPVASHPALKALFPPAFPYLWKTDRF